MAKNYGTLSLFSETAPTTPINTFGEARAAQILQANLNAHNRMVDEAIADFAEVTTDNLRSFGSAVTGEMVDADEHAAPEAQRRQSASTNVGFPLRNKQFGVQWTQLWMETHTMADLEKEYLAARVADIREIHKAVRVALFKPTNTLGYVDRRVANPLTYDLRALLNADSTTIPQGPNFETFNPATHTHYIVSGAAYVTAAGATALVETVLEHGHTGGGSIRVYINRADEGDKDTANSGWRALPGFAPYVDMQVVQPATGGYVAQNLDQVNLYNRAIGKYRGATVFVKPWVPQGYAFAFDASTPLKPLCFRVRDGAPQLGQLRIAAEWREQYPLRATGLEREFGVGVWTRSNGAVLQNTAGSYAAPSINLIV